MGFRDQVKDKADTNPAAAVGWRSPCPHPASHIVTEVNRGSIRMQTWQGHLNEMYGRGYRLAHVFEQDGNTVQVYEHTFHA